METVSASWPVVSEQYSHLVRGRVRDRVRGRA